MAIFIKAAVLSVITVVLYLLLSKQNKDIGVLLTLAACCVLLAVAMSYLDTVFSFLQRLQAIAKLDSDLMTILMKAVGAGILAEISALICTDAGNAALGKALQFMAVSVILWMSLPLFTSLIELVEEILSKA